MGKLGILFEVPQEDKGKNLGKTKLEKDNLVVFVKKSEVYGDYVVGDKTFKKEDCDFVYLDKGLCFDSFHVFENSRFKAGKISLAERTFVDFENLTFWFGSEKYRKLRQLFELNDNTISFEDLIKARMMDILEYL